MEKYSSLSLLDYKQFIFRLSAWLRQLRNYAETLGLTEVIQSVDDMLHRVESNSFEIAVVGEFKRGKSTLINALLGQEILPADILPTTATLNRITYGLKNQVKIRFKNGLEEMIAIDQLSQYVTKLTPEAEVISTTVHEAIVYYPVSYCQNNVDIIDTPGLSDEAAMTETTLAVLPQVDAAIFVIMAQAPFSESERLFLESNLLTADLGRVLFVVTGIDRCNHPEDVEKVIQNVEAQIKNSVLKGAKEKFGINSDEYQGYLSRIGHPKVLGVSAYQALQAKKNGDSNLLKQSHFPELEITLEKFLTEERGLVFLQVPVNRIISVAKTVLSAIESQQVNLNEEKNSLREDYAQALTSLAEEENNIEKAQSEYKRIFEIVQQQMIQLLNQFEPDLKQTGIKFVETVLLTSHDFNSSIVGQKMVNLDSSVSDKLETQCRCWAGKIQIELQRHVKEVSQNPSTLEQISQLLNQVGLLCVNLGTAIKKSILQERIALKLANDTVGGVGGWMNKTLRSQDLVSTFKNRYKSQIAEAVSRQIAINRTSQQIYDEIVASLNTIGIEAPQSEILQKSVAEKRLSLERDETRIELQLKSLRDIQQNAQPLLNDVQEMLAHLIHIIGVNQT